MKNMNCTEFNALIDDFVDGQLNQQLGADCEQHLAVCPDCACKLESMTAMLEKLHRLEVAQSTTGFEQRAFAEVRRQYRPAGRHYFAAGFVAAMAASVAIWFSVFVSSPQQPVDSLRAVAVTLNQAQAVRLLFEAKEDIQQVSMTIDLPENMVLEGYPGRQQLSWRTSLKKGSNVLSLPIMAVGEGQGELVAQLSYDGKIKTFRVVLKAINDGVMHYQPEAMKST
jgi:hypothetical protein